MKYDFDTPVSRYGTNSAKWDAADRALGGKGLIPMWVADMDFRAPESIISAARKVVDIGIFGYGHTPPSFNEAVCDWMHRRHGWDIKPEWIVFSPGVVPALNFAVQAFTSPGDEVMVQTPVYFPFFSAISNNLRKIIDSPMELVNGRFRFNIAELEAKITSRTRLLLLCSPHNPAGRVWSPDELIEIGELCRRNNIIIFSDEVHHDIVYPGNCHTVFPLIGEDYSQSCLVGTSVSKTFNLAGLQLSSIIVPNENLRKTFRESLSRCAVSYPNIFAINICEAAYRQGEDWLDQLIQYLSGNLSYLREYLSTRLPSIRMIEPEATYLVLLDCRGLGLPPERLKKFMRAEAGVGTEECTVFGMKEVGFERMNIACPRSQLTLALDRIADAVGRI
jgi:cystathionine beta-lyase